MNKHLLAILFTGISLAALAQAPGIKWQRSYGGSAADFANDLQLTDDGGYIIAGYTYSNNGHITVNKGLADVWVLKLSVLGAIEWQRTLGGSGVDAAETIRPTPDGGYILTGTSASNNGDISGNQGSFDLLVVKLAADGAIQWQRSLGGSGYDAGRDIVQTLDGGYIVVGRTTSTNGDVTGNAGGSDFWIVKLDDTGNIQWQKCYGTVNYEDAYSVQQLEDGSYIVAGETSTIESGTGFSIKHFYIIKLTESGDAQWQRVLGGSRSDIAHIILATADGGYFVTGSSESNNGDVSGNRGLQDYWAVKLSENGTIEWQRCIGGSGGDFALDAQITEDGGYLIAGTSGSSNGDVTGALGSFDCWIVKISSSGELEWQKSYGGTDYEEARAIRFTPDGGYIMAGFTRSQNRDVSVNFGDFDVWLAKLNILPSVISGVVQRDSDFDCETDDNDFPLYRWLVRAEGEDAIYYALSDTAGHYSMPVDTGEYELSVMPAYAPGFWTVCNLPATVLVPLLDDTIHYDIYAQTFFDCSFLVVDIATDFLRRCSVNKYVINYCNHGPSPALGAYIEITLDPFMEYYFASIPLLQQNGNTVSFYIGDVPPYECGSFDLYVWLDPNCDLTELGQTHCIEAHIFPDSICIPPNSLWDGSSIVVEALCEGDSAVFVLHNTGTGAMSQQRQYIIIEDDIVLVQSTFQLDAAQTQEIGVVAQGATLHLEAQQSPGHPAGIASSGVTIEGCNGWITTSLFNQWPLNNPNPFVDIYCRDNIGAYDPNDKNAFPVGFGPQRLIEPGQDIEYMIRFQNTGTDTAFKVVIVDVLPPELDLGTLRPGAASHPYTYSVTPEGQPVFTFDNILLPDSTANLEASQGFVNFRISQQPGLPIGTEIANKALIYFDFNEPIETNYALHRIGIVFPWAPPDIVSTRPVTSPAMQVRAIPNPFDDRALLQVEGIEPGRLRLILTNSFGQVLHAEETFGTAFEFRRGVRQAGLYFFRIEREGRLVGAGKIILR